MSELIVLYPAQLWLAKQMGLVRGEDYIVYSCLKCHEDMDRCKCKEGKRNIK